MMKLKALHLPFLITLFAGAGMLIYSGCTRVINRSAERRIRDTLPAYIGPAKEWRAHVENPPDQTLHGHLAHVTIDGDRVFLRDTILLDSLHIDLRGVEVDERKQQLKKVAETRFSAVITEPDLNKYLLDNPAPSEEPVTIKYVHLIRGKMRVDATRRLLWKDWNYTLEVEPVLTSSTHLDFSPDRMSVIGVRVPLPASWLQWLAKRLSKGFDFSTLPFPVEISKFEAQDGQIVVTGNADVLSSLNARIGRQN